MIHGPDCRCTAYRCRQVNIVTKLVSPKPFPYRFRVLPPGRRRQSDLVESAAGRFVESRFATVPGIRPGLPASPGFSNIPARCAAASNRRAVCPTLPRTFPKSGTTKTYVPAGRNYANDRNILVNNPRYVNPYGSGYYGFYDSPFYYIWLFSILDDDQNNNPLPPQSDEGKIAPIIPSELGVISALVDEVQSK